MHLEDLARQLADENPFAPIYQKDAEDGAETLAIDRTHFLVDDGTVVDLAGALVFALRDFARFDTKGFGTDADIRGFLKRENAWQRLLVRFDNRYC